MIAQVNDNRGINTRYDNVSVQVNVLRNQSPFFVNQPYITSISERRNQSLQVYSVSARDNDLIGDIVYTVVGDVPAPSYFSLNPVTGAIFIQDNLQLDTLLSYTVRPFFQIIMVSVINCFFFVFAKYGRIPF